jgi:hypothetical protein
MRKPDKDESNPLTKWWGKLLAAVMFFGGAVAVFRYLEFLEQRGGGLVHWLIAVLYYIGGKWTAAVAAALPGLFFLRRGIQQLLDPERREPDKRPWIR